MKQNAWKKNSELRGIWDTPKKEILLLKVVLE